MRLRKEALIAIFQTKVESRSKNIDPFLLGKLIELLKSPSFPLFEEILKQHSFKDIKQHIVSTTGAESQMTVMYLKDVSTTCQKMSTMLQKVI